MRPLVLDRAQPGVQRVAERARVVQGRRWVARPDPALRDAVLLVRVLGVALRSERPDVDPDALGECQDSCRMSEC